MKDNQTDNIIEKVTAFITRSHNGVCQMLLFRHPHAGIQIPAGTVEEGEDIEAAALREASEETGLHRIHVTAYLGAIENELAGDEVVTAAKTCVYVEPNTNSIAHELALPRGMTLHRNHASDGFTNITHIEYVCYPDQQYVITGWIPDDKLSNHKRRHLFHLTTDEPTPPRWQLESDGGQMFEPFWAPLVPKPSVIEPQAEWLDLAYEQLCRKVANH